MPANNDAQFNSRFSLGGKVLAGRVGGATFATIPVTDATLVFDPGLITSLNDGDSYTNHTNAFMGGSLVCSWARGAVFPKYHTNVINGEPVIRFTNSPSEPLISDAAFTCAQSYGLTTTTVYIVVKPDALVLNGFCSWGAAAADQVGFLMDASDLGFNHANDTTGRIIGALPGGWAGNFHIIEGYRNGDARELNADGASIATGSNAATCSGVSRTCALGRQHTNRELDGDMAFMAVFNRALTTQERADMHTWLRERYATY